MNKNLVKTLALSAVTATLLSFSGCGEEDTSSGPSTGGGGTSLPSDSNTVLRGDITSDMTLTADKKYTLAGNKIKIKNGATLTIEAGTKIYGESQAYLIVTKGSKIMAEGTVASPIIFDSIASQNGDEAKAGQWGGVTVLGSAQVNEANLFYEVDEADADFAYGSTATTGNSENSGVLKYVNILNSGYAVATDKEVNGLSLCGIGSGTTVENINIVNSKDDGIEIWGGTVNLKDISIIGAEDDSFDIDNGYTGTVTNLYVEQTTPGAALVEMTNSGDASIVRTNVTINGFTLKASENQKKEGGLYFKDQDVTGTFTNGTVDMSKSVAADGALHNRKGVFTSPVFTGLTVTKSATVTVRATGGADDIGGAGVATLNTAFDADPSNSETTGLPAPTKAQTLQGDITADMTLTQDTIWTLAGNKVKVKNNAVLTIEAGTKIYGESQAYLIITKGSQIIANGTSQDPIVFNSVAAQNGDAPQAGQWGGVTVLGSAQVNEENLFYEVDEADADFAYGSTGTGGNTESSGSLKYVKIYNSGYAVAPDKEVNGLSLCGIGSGTTVENISIVNSKDDGVEIWGGTVNLKDISIIGAEDDSFDIDNGYTGTVTNLYVQQTTPGAALVEMTNSGDAAIVRTDVTINGFTLIASENQKKEGGLYFKDADVTGTFTNGTIDMTKSVAADGALHNRKGVYDSPVFTGLSITKSATVTDLSTGGADDIGGAGVTILDAAFAADVSNEVQ